MIATSDIPKAQLLFEGAVLVGKILGRLPRRAKTSNGYNDTSVAKARLPEYPGVVRVQCERLAIFRLLSAYAEGLRTNTAHN